METKATAIIAATNRNILLGIVERNTNRNAVARKANIAPTTFNRKLDGVTDWTIPELGRVAEALDKALFGEIVPAELVDLGATG